MVLFCMTGIICLSGFAQVAKIKPGIYCKSYQMIPRNSTQESVLKSPVKANPLKGLKKQENNPNAVTVLNLGTSANSMGYSYGTRTMLWADDDLKAVINIHRMGPGTTPPGLSGYLAMDLGVNEGATQADWTNSIQVYASTLPASPNYFDACRYPSAAIYNPKNNTDLSKAFLAYFAPNFCNNTFSGFGGYSYGTDNLVNHADSVKKLKWYAPPPYTYIPDGFTIAGDGVAHMVDIDYKLNGSVLEYQDSIIYGRGVWDSTINNFNYTYRTIAFPTVGHYPPADVKIAASLDGQTLYMTILGEMQNVGVVTLRDSSLFPIYRKSYDGGLTWTSAVGIQLDGPNGLAQLKNHYSQHFIDSIFGAGTVRDQIPYTTAFDHSTSVDRWGNLHMGVVIGFEPGYYSIDNMDSINVVYDIYTCDRGLTWWAQYMGDLKTFRGSWNGSGGIQTCDNRTYCSRNKSGDKLFFTWNDTHIAGDSMNDSPDVFARGFDVLSNMITTDIFGSDHPANVTSQLSVSAQSYYQCTSPIVFTDNDQYKIPICVEWWSSPSADVNFKYISNFSFQDINFSIWAQNPPADCWWGINEKKKDVPIVTIYPNPAVDFTEVSLNLKENAGVSVSVMNLVGQEVLFLNKGTMHAGTQLFSVETKNLTPGIYFIMVIINGERIVQKLIVE